MTPQEGLLGERPESEQTDGSYKGVLAQDVQYAATYAGRGGS